MHVAATNLRCSHAIPFGNIFCIPYLEIVLKIMRIQRSDSPSVKTALREISSPVSDVDDPSSSKV